MRHPGAGASACYDAQVVRKLLWLPLVMMAASCTAPRTEHASLTPLTAAQLLRNDTPAQNRMKEIQRQDRTCEYKLEVPPDQKAHPDWVQVDHVVTCGGNTHPAAYDASIEFQFNKQTKEWEITRLGS
jgi:hypothetical protein